MLYRTSLLYTSTDLAEQILGIIATAFITTMTFTFSTTMVVLTMYSSQFSPRVVENFLTQQTTLKSFAVFLSGFIYAITSLLFLDTSGTKSVVISAVVGVVYIIIGLVYFLRFINNVSTYVQASNLIKRLQDKATDNINRYKEFIQKATIISGENIRYAKEKQAIISPKNGYIQEIHYKKLYEIAKKNEIIVYLDKVVGQFITDQTSLGMVYYEQEQEIKEKDLEEIQRCVYVGEKKTETQDFRFAVQKIVEIALKALSPGINDPYTAIHCIHILGLLLREIAEFEKGYVVMKEEEEKGYMISEAYDFEVIIEDSFDQIIHYGREDAYVALAVLKSLKSIREKSSFDNTKIVEAYAKRLYQKMKAEHNDPAHLEKIEYEITQLKEMKPF